MSEREEVKPIECDCCGGTWGYINADNEHDIVWDCVQELTRQRDALRSKLASAEKVVSAAIRYIDGDVNDPWGYQEDDRYDDLWEAVTDEKDRRARAKETKR